MEVGNELLENHDEFRLGGLHLVLFPDLVEGEGGRWFFPLWLWQLQEFIEDEVIGFLFVPTVGEQFAPEAAYLVN